MLVKALVLADGFEPFTLESFAQLRTLETLINKWFYLHGSNVLGSAAQIFGLRIGMPFVTTLRVHGAAGDELFEALRAAVDIEMDLMQKGVI